MDVTFISPSLCPSFTPSCQSVYQSSTDLLFIYLLIMHIFFSNLSKQWKGYRRYFKKTDTIQSLNIVIYKCENDTNTYLVWNSGSFQPRIFGTNAVIFQPLFQNILSTVTQNLCFLEFLLDSCYSGIISLLEALSTTY